MTASWANPATVSASWNSILCSHVQLTYPGACVEVHGMFCCWVFIFVVRLLHNNFFCIHTNVLLRWYTCSALSCRRAADGLRHGPLPPG